MKQTKPYLIEIELEEGTLSRSNYDDLYLDSGLAQIESFYLWLLDQIPLQEHGRFLDISCGTGELIQMIADVDLRGIGLDISSVAIRRAAETSSQASNFIVAAGEHLPVEDQSIDVVTNIGSLEHFLDPAGGIREIRRVLKTDGVAVILVPNTFSLLSNIWSVLRSGHIAVDKQPIQRYGSRSDWVVLLRNNGLAVQRTIKYERPFPRSWSDTRHYLRRPKELIRVLLSPLIPINLAYAFLFICKARLSMDETDI